MPCHYCGARRTYDTHAIDTDVGTIYLDGYCCDRAQDDDAAIDAMAEAYDDEADLAEALARGEVDARDPEEIVRDFFLIEGVSR
jgi:hypothetical protein